MKQFPLFATLAASLLLFLSCFNHDNDPELIIEINIQGTVKDAATGKPIADAEVTLSFEEKTLQKSKTNSKGAFSFPVSQDGNYQLSVQATGYRNAEKSFPLTNLSNNAMDIKMTLANSLTITNESSYDIENVKWSNGNASFGSIKIAGSVEVPVDTGSGYVFFTRSNDRLNVHTEYVYVSQGERRKYIVADTTIVVEVGYGENKKTLSEIKTANPNPVSSSSSEPSSSSAAATLPSSGSKQPSSSSGSPVVMPSSNSNSPVVPTSSSSSAAQRSSSSGTSPSPSSNSATLCNGQAYNSATEFCYNNNQVVAKCEGKIYSTSQFCYEDKIYSRCGTADYNPSTSFCLGGAVKPKCNGSEYAATQFCFGSDLYYKCGSSSSGAEYNPTAENCCGSNKYSLTEQFCYNTAVYNKCNGADYKIATEGCCNNEKYSLATQFCHENSKLASFCSTANKQTYNPNLYECKPEINPNGIYLKGGIEHSGKIYNAVLIGTQTWMTEDLNSVNWATAMEFLPDCNSKSCSSLILPKHQGICPNGWHIPSNAELVLGTEFMDKSGWGSIGTDIYGFSALPNPECYFMSGGVRYICGAWWTATEYSASNAYYKGINAYGNTSSNTASKTSSYSVRCLKD